MSNQLIINNRGYVSFLRNHSAMEKRAYLGIDLGSSNTAAALRLVGETKSLEVVPMDDNGRILLPSIVEYKKCPNRMVTPIVAPKINLNSVKEGNVVMHMKRLIGRKYNSDIVKAFAPKCKAEVREGPDGFAAFWIPALGRSLLPSEVCAEIVKQVFRRVMKFLQQYPDHKLSGVGVTVPALFSQDQRIATKKAVKIALDGMKREFPNESFFQMDVDVKLYNEPSAAALTYCHESNEGDGYIMTYDLGGGTFDVTVMKVEEGKHYTVVKSRGINTIGGANFDECILKYVMETFANEYDQKLLPPPDSTNYFRYLSKLEACCREAKEELSTTPSTYIDLNYYINNALGRSDGGFEPVYDVQLTRERVGNLIKNSLDLTLMEISSTLGEAGLKQADIRKVVLVGGSTRLPQVREMLSKYFPGRISEEVNVDDCVSRGAALFVYEEVHKTITVKDQTKLNIYTQPVNKGKTGLKIFIPRGTPLPVTKTKTFWTREDHIGMVKDKLYEGATPETAHQLASLVARGITDYEDGRAVELLYTISVSTENIISYSVSEVESKRVLVEDTVVSYKSS